MGEIELEGSVLVIRRIHVHLILKTAEENHEVATRVHGVFADKCPVYLTLKPAVAITTELIFQQSE